MVATMPKTCHFDVTINVVTSKTIGSWLNYESASFALYFYAVAKKIYLESNKPRPSRLHLPPPDRTEVELACTCLDKCLQEMDPTRPCW